MNTHPAIKAFVEQVLVHPGFESRTKLESLVAKYESPLDLLQAVIDEKVLLREDVCRLWAKPGYWLTNWNQKRRRC